MPTRVMLKLAVIAGIAAVPTFIVYGVTKNWESVVILWACIGSLVGCFMLFRGSVFLLRKALIFLGMKPETLDSEYGNGPWWRY